MIAAILAGREERELLRVALVNGSAHTGRCTIVAGQHFLICADPKNLVGRVEGPLEEMDLSTVEVLQTRAEALAQGRQRLMGDRVPGREPVTRDDFEQRLRVIARAIANTLKEDWQRGMQLRRQFDEVAERIHLAAAKRQCSSSVLRLLDEALFRKRTDCLRPASVMTISRSNRTSTGTPSQTSSAVSQFHQRRVDDKTR